MRNILLILICLIPFLDFAQCNSNEITVIVNITPDNYPSETSWDIVIQGGGQIASGTFNSDTLCLSNTNCYTFTIYDQVGDGICCAFGTGSYNIYADSVLLKSGGNFGSSESTKINCAPVDHDLPLFVINTNGQTIPDEPGIIVEMGVIDNGIGNFNRITDPFNNYDGYADIEIRGQTSQWFDKKSYGFETTYQSGLDSNVSLLGFPSEEDWVLHGPYADKSLIRNALAMSIARSMGHYSSRTKFCEVYINDDYKGVYVLMEKIKRDKNRVNIAKLKSTEITGDDRTGGYIFKIDKGGGNGWNSKFGIVTNPGTKIRYQYVYPKPDSIATQQQGYLKNYVDSFELALNSNDFIYGGKRYDEIIDLGSFVDNYIINELAKDVDAYRISAYFSKDKNSNGGKLKSMPMWDFNLAFNNANYCNNTPAQGWMYDLHCDDGNPFWYNRMRLDSAFNDILKCHWDKLRLTVLDETYLLQHIDSLDNMLTNAEVRNFERWDILGQYVWPNPTPYLNTHQEHIDRVKTYISDRLDWMDQNITGNPNCSLYDPPEPIAGNLNKQKEFIKVYPNPTNEIINVSWSNGIVVKTTIFNQFGQLMLSIANESKIDISQIASGAYFMKVESSLGRVEVVKIIKE